MFFFIGFMSFVVLVTLLLGTRFFPYAEFMAFGSQRRYRFTLISLLVLSLVMFSGHYYLNLWKVEHFVYVLEEGEQQVYTGDPNQAGLLMKEPFKVGTNTTDLLLLGEQIPLSMELVYYSKLHPEDKKKIIYTPQLTEPAVSEVTLEINVIGKWRLELYNSATGEKWATIVFEVQE